MANGSDDLTEYIFRKLPYNSLVHPGPVILFGMASFAAAIAIQNWIGGMQPGVLPPIALLLFIAGIILTAGLEFGSRR